MQDEIAPYLNFPISLLLHPPSSFSLSLSRFSICGERKRKKREKANGSFQTYEWSRGFNVQLQQEDGERVKLGDCDGGKKEKDMLKQDI